MRLTIITLSLTVVLACGEAPAISLDGGTDGAVPDSLLDASVDSSLDAGSLLFGPLEFLSELNSEEDERYPTLASDGLSIYFAREQNFNGFAVNVPYVARRTSLDSSFDAPTVAGFFGTVSIHEFEVANDELEWFVWRGLGQVARTTRANSSVAWSTPTQVGFDGFSPTLNADQTTIITITLTGALQRRVRDSRLTLWNSPTMVNIELYEIPRAVDQSVDGEELLLTLDSGVYISRREGNSQSYGAPELLFAGSFENARFGAQDSLVTLTIATASSSQIALAQRN